MYDYLVEDRTVRSRGLIVRRSSSKMFPARSDPQWLLRVPGGCHQIQTSSISFRDLPVRSGNLTSQGSKQCARSKANLDFHKPPYTRPSRLLIPQVRDPGVPHSVLNRSWPRSSNTNRTDTVRSQMTRVL